MGGNQRHIELIGRGVLVENGRVLLCRNTKHGYYYLPGGHIEFGESAASAVIREFMEETGLTILVGDCVLVSEGAFETAGKTHHELNVVFHVERGDDRPVGNETPRSKEEGIAFEFVDLAAIVSTDVRPLAIRAWLASGGLADQGHHGRAECIWASEIIDPK